MDKMVRRHARSKGLGNLMKILLSLNVITWEEWAISIGRKWKHKMVEFNSDR